MSMRCIKCDCCGTILQKDTYVKLEIKANEHWTHNGYKTSSKEEDKTRDFCMSCYKKL